MSWQKVKQAFFVKKDGKCIWIDIAICGNCNGIHIPPEEANGCEGISEEIETYKDLIYRLNNSKVKKE